MLWTLIKQHATISSENYLNPSILTTCNRSFCGEIKSQTAATVNILIRRKKYASWHCFCRRRWTGAYAFDELHARHGSTDYADSMSKLVNSNVGWETPFPVSVAFTPATLPSKQIALAAAEHKQEVRSHNLNLVKTLEHESCSACDDEEPAR